MMFFSSFIAQIALEDKVSSLLKQSFLYHDYSKIFFALFSVGLLMNLTPCVYPLIPITLGFFNRQSNKNFFYQFKLSLSYLIGIAFSFGILGCLTAFSGIAFGILFTKPWFSIGLGIFLVLFSLSMFDFYSIRLPHFINRFIIARNGILGAFIMGMIMGITATPCTGPLLIAAFIELVNLKNPFLCLLSFIIIGLGLGTPYFLLGCFSKGTQVLPNSGGWLNWVKSVLGICVLAIGLSYIIMGLPKEILKNSTHLIWIGFYGISFILLLKAQLKTHRFEGFLYGLSFVLVGWFLKSEWDQYHLPSSNLKATVSSSTFIPFTSDSYQKAKNSAKPTFIYVTADWCKVCKQVQTNVFDQPSISTLFKDTELLKIDWSTHVDEEYISYIQKLFPIPGLPYFIFLKPNGQLSHTTGDVRSIEDLKSNLLKARGH